MAVPSRRLVLLGEMVHYASLLLCQAVRQYKLVLLRHLLNAATVLLLLLLLLLCQQLPPDDPQPPGCRNHLTS
jgi:hypothetical protein